MEDRKRALDEGGHFTVLTEWGSGKCHMMGPRILEKKLYFDRLGHDGTFAACPVQPFRCFQDHAGASTFQHIARRPKHDRPETPPLRGRRPRGVGITGV